MYLAAERQAECAADLYRQRQHRHQKVIGARFSHQLELPPPVPQESISNFSVSPAFEVTCLNTASAVGLPNSHFFFVFFLGGRGRGRGRGSEDVFACIFHEIPHGTRKKRNREQEKNE